MSVCLFCYSWQHWDDVLRSPAPVTSGLRNPTLVLIQLDSLKAMKPLKNQAALTLKKINYNNNKKEIQTYFAAPAGCLYLPTWHNTSVWLNETVYIWCANQNHGLQIAHYYKTAEWVIDWREKMWERDVWFIQRSKTLPKIECRVV